jgi:RNA polymerase sigma-70 factor (family 1)
MEMNKLAAFPDFELFTMLQQGDEAAFLEIYDRYKNVLQNHAYKKLGDIDEVEDIIQELFIYLWDKRETLTLTGSLPAYLFTAVRNRVFGHFNQKQRETAYLASLREFVEKGEYTTDLSIISNELEVIIDNEINALPDRMREVLVLSRKHGYSHKQIAEHFGTSEHTVSKQISNALKTLKVKLGPLLSLLLIL